MQRNTSLSIDIIIVLLLVLLIVRICVVLAGELGPLAICSPVFAHHASTVHLALASPLLEARVDEPSRVLGAAELVVLDIVGEDGQIGPRRVELVQFHVVCIEGCISLVST